MICIINSISVLYPILIDLKCLYIYILIGLLPILSLSQDKVEGMVMEANTENKHLGLPGANVYWMNSQIGTITNDEGLFSIPFSEEYNKLK